MSSTAKLQIKDESSKMMRPAYPERNRCEADCGNKTESILDGSSDLVAQSGYEACYFSSPVTTNKVQARSHYITPKGMEKTSKPPGSVFRDAWTQTPDKYVDSRTREFLFPNLAHTKRTQTPSYFSVSEAELLFQRRLVGYKCGTWPQPLGVPDTEAKDEGVGPVWPGDVKYY